MSMQTEPSALSDARVLDQLCALIHLDFDAIEAYEAAIARLDHLGHREQLRHFLADHRRHVRELTECVHTFGGTAPVEGDIKRFLTKGKVVLATIAGDRAILRAMRSNEQQTTDAYERAFNALGGSSLEVRRVVERGMDDERRHKAWFEAQLEAG
jgi:rubrerythrin